MVVLGGGAVSFERGTPVHEENGGGALAFTAPNMAKIREGPQLSDLST